MANSALEVDLSHVRLERHEVVRHAASLRTGLSSLDGGEQGGFLRLSERKDLLRQIQIFQRDLRSDVTDVVQLGIGGSSLGAQTLCGALLPAGHNTFGDGPLRFHFPDNIDPETFGSLLDSLDPKRTLVHVVSKSGGTLETLAQMHAMLESFREDRRFKPAKSFVVTTGAKGSLRDFAEDEGIPVLTFPEDVGGRFSVFTASGLLVPALCGVPVAKVLAGARRMEARCREDSLVGPAGRLAAILYEHDQLHQRPIHVDFVYADALVTQGAWFVQLWAESLGKAGRGPTPIVARGTTDQHSQLQLYTEGPDDKVYTMIRVDRFRDKVKIGRDGAPPMIGGRQLADLMAAEAQGTTEALIAQERPLVELRLPRITPEGVGELLLMRQLQTALAGSLYRVNPFDQPGVEAGKRAALRILSGEAGEGTTPAPAPTPTN
jgi:glucose-6-phosphate isomerase